MKQKDIARHINDEGNFSSRIRSWKTQDTLCMYFPSIKTVILYDVYGIYRLAYFRVKHIKL